MILTTRGIANSALSAYENARKIPNLVTAAKIARALGVSIERLYYGDENEVFVNAAPDVGRRIVHCVYLLWELGVIYYYEDIKPVDFYTDPFEDADRNGIYLQVVKYPASIKRLMNSLNEYRSRISTFAEPERYLEMLLSSVAVEINEEIAQEKRILK